MILDWGQSILAVIAAIALMTNWVDDTEMERCQSVLYSFAFVCGLCPRGRYEESPKKKNDS